MPTPAPPPLRPLERHQPPGAPGRMALRDPLGVAPQAAGRALVLEPAAWAIARHFDGRRTLERLAEEAAGELGRPVAPDQVAELAQRLSEALLLADGRFDAALGRAFEVFRRVERRPAAGPGRHYVADPFELRLFVGGLVADDWDLPPLAGGQGLWAPAGRLGAAAALHSRAWAAVRHLAGSLARVVVLANAGAPYAEPLIPLAKPFELPLGTVEPDREALAALGALPGRLQLAHGADLGIECALLFVRLLFPRVPVVPVLVSALDAPDGESQAERAADALARVLDLDGRTLLVAAADLVRSGAGGGESGPTPPPRGAARGAWSGSFGAALRDHDATAIDLAAALDHAAFRAHALSTGDPARAAAAAAPYHLLRALEPRPALAPEASGSERIQGSTLGYLQSSGGGELATATTMVFH